METPAMNVDELTEKLIDLKVGTKPITSGTFERCMSFDSQNEEVSAKDTYTKTSKNTASKSKLNALQRQQTERKPLSNLTNTIKSVQTSINDSNFHTNVTAFYQAHKPKNNNSVASIQSLVVHTSLSITYRKTQTNKQRIGIESFLFY